MTQEEIKALHSQFDAKLVEVTDKQKNLKAEKYETEMLYQRHREYLNGQADAYREMTSTLLSMLLKQSLADVQKNREYIENPTNSTL